MISNQAPILRTDASSQPRAVATNAAPGRSGVRNLQQLVQLRWIAVFGQVATIAAVHFWLGIHLPLQPMLLVLAALVVFNLACMFHLRRDGRVGYGVLLASLLIDVASLTLQLYLSGGMTNPFVFLYLLQVVLGAVLLPQTLSWIVVIATAAGLGVLVAIPGPVSIPAHPERGLLDPYVQGSLLCLLLVATLLVVFVGRISRNIRARDARLAELRQRAAEEEHIIRMGLLASGAAHELGTPLSTMAVILGDWQHLPHFNSDPELLQDVIEMQEQVLRCKSIVTGILLSAGHARGEAPLQTSVRTFLAEVVDEWKASRSIGAVEYQDRFGRDQMIIADSGLKQMLLNVLDNALEASPDWIGIEISREQDALLVAVRDRGRGFEPQMLAQLGKPYHSSKNRPGRGLGLFLSLNVARTLGGTLTAVNGKLGAIVTMRLPLSALTLDQDDDDGTDDGDNDDVTSESNPR